MAVAVAEATPEKPINADLPVSSYRKRLSHNSLRARVGSWLAMRAMEPNITNIEVARRMGISPFTLNNYIYEARKAGWLEFTDPISRLEHEIIPKAVQNLSEFLDKKDKQVTIEVAKGTIFKQFQEAKGVSESPRTVLALKIEMPPSAPSSTSLAPGMVVGVPRIIEDE